MTDHTYFIDSIHKEALRSEPADGMVCCVEGCNKKATDYWLPTVCALAEAGITPEWVGMCAQHDVELNEHYVRFLCGNKYDEALSIYRASRLP